MNEIIFRVINRAYHKNLAIKLAPYSSINIAQIQTEITNQTKLIFNNNRALAVDFAGYIHIKIAALVQASYLVLSQHINDKAVVIEILKFALIEALKKFLASPFRLALNISKSSFIKILNLLPMNLINRIIFGKGFAMITTVRDSGLHEFNYHTCLYNEFFRRNSTPELTQIICYADHAWIDVIDHIKHSMKFERPSTLANGQDRCVFQLVKLNRQK